MMRILKHQRALQVARAVQAGREPEVTLQQRARAAESFDHLRFIHGRCPKRLLYLARLRLVWPLAESTPGRTTHQMRTIFLILLLIPAAATAQSDPAPGGQIADIRRLTMNEAVETALENNLGIRVARLEPEIQDAGVAQARAV